MEIVAELKIDGVAFSALYKNGVLIQGLTRGDGVSGENITENIRSILPANIAFLSTELAEEFNHIIPDILEVRGEIYMLCSTFEELNKDRISRGEQPFSNLRNAAAGSIRQLDAEVTKSRNLQYAIHGWGEFPYIKTWSGNINKYTYTYVMKYISALGLYTVQDLMRKTCEELRKATNRQ